MRRGILVLPSEAGLTAGGINAALVYMYTDTVILQAVEPCLFGEEQSALACRCLRAHTSQEDPYLDTTRVAREAAAALRAGVSISSDPASWSRRAVASAQELVQYPETAHAALPEIGMAPETAGAGLISGKAGWSMEEPSFEVDFVSDLSYGVTARD